jgi:Cu-Zn family superoxide dismutase
LSLVAVLRGDSNVKGTVTFEQADENSQTTVSWNITGHDANAERGMHVHAFGDNTNGCTSAGPHCESKESIAHRTLWRQP